MFNKHPVYELINIYVQRYIYIQVHTSNYLKSYGFRFSKICRSLCHKGIDFDNIFLNFYNGKCIILQRAKNTKINR